jgi:hypothetical protein
MKAAARQEEDDGGERGVSLPGASALNAELAVLGMFLLRPPSENRADTGGVGGGCSVGGGGSGRAAGCADGSASRGGKRSSTAVLASATNLAAFPPMQQAAIDKMMRHIVKEFVGGATLKAGVRGTCTIGTVGYNIHAKVDAASGVAGAIVVTQAYPRRVAWKAVEGLISKCVNVGACGLAVRVVRAHFCDDDAQ